MKNYELSRLHPRPERRGFSLLLDKLDKSLADLDNLPEPDDLAAEIIENLEAGLECFREITASIKL